MKKQTKIQALYAASLLAISLATIPAQAALTNVAAQPNAEQAIVDDSITPEAAAPQPKVVNRTTVVTQAAPLNADVVAVPAATKPSAGQQLDAGMKAKMDDVQGQFEKALMESLDHIKVNVTDDRSQTAAPGQAQTVQDNLVGAQSAEEKANYIAVKDAPNVKDGDGQSVAGLQDDDAKKKDKSFHLSPVFGVTSINDSYYQISARYAAGFELEADVDPNFSVVFGYTYSQYNLGLGSSNPFYGYGNTSGLSTLGYNQNMFELDGRFYLMPKDAKFRIFGGAGVGYELGYLNYNNNQYLGNYNYNPYYNQGTSDYEVKDWMGILSAGMQFNISDSIALGALFKYGFVVSSSQNQPLNNYGFVPNGYNYGTTTNQQVVGGSLQNDGFYSILGTVKVAF